MPLIYKQNLFFIMQVFFIKFQYFIQLTNNILTAPKVKAHLTEYGSLDIMEKDSSPVESNQPPTTTSDKTDPDPNLPLRTRHRAKNSTQDNQKSDKTNSKDNHLPLAGSYEFILLSAFKKASCDTLSKSQLLELAKSQYLTQQQPQARHFNNYTVWRYMKGLMGEQLVIKTSPSEETYTLTSKVIILACFHGCVFRN